MKGSLTILLFFALQATAQVASKPVKLVQYVLDTFTAGSVKLKSGAVSNQNLNYNILTSEMIFEQDGKYMAIAAPTDVDTVFIAHRPFVPVGDAFYEWLGGSSYPLFVQYSCTVKEPGTQTGFGTTTTAAATSFKSLIKESSFFSLKLPDEYELSPKQTFYVYKKRKYIKIKNKSELTELFPDKKGLINDWVQQHSTRFSKSDELLLLLQQLQ